MEVFGPIQWVLVAILAILVIIFFYYVPFMLWINAVVSGVHHQAPQSLGFSRQEHWSGLPFPPPMHESEK